VRIERFQRADGLPSNAIQATMTDRRGYLWVATGQGLARFDGRRWRVFDSRNTPALVSSEIRNLHLLRDGRLLVALASGAILLRDGDGFGELATLDIAANQIHEAADGVMTVAGTKLIELGVGRPPELLVDNPGSGELIQLAVHGSRRFLLFPRTGLIQEWQGARHTSNREWRLNAVDAEDLLTVWEGDQLWIVSAFGRWRLDVRNEELKHYDHRLEFKPRVAARGPDGWWWIGGRGDAASLCRVRSLESADACESIPIEGRNVTSLAMDGHGALWVSSWDAGLFRITAPPIAAFGNGRVQSLLALGDGGVVAQSRSAAIRINGERVEPMAWSPPSDSGDTVLSLAELPDGRLVRGRRQGIDIASAPLFKDWSPLPSTLRPAHAAYALYVDRTGALWTGNEHANFYLDGQWTTLPEPMALQYAYAEAPDGTFWAATSEGIYRKRPGQGFRLADAPKPRARLIAMSALTDSRGHVWFGGYESGLYRHDGKAWLHLDSTRGLPDDTAYGLVEDAQQRLWISHGRGLYTLSLAEADRLAADPSALAKVREYGFADGVPVDGFNGGSGLAAVRDRAGMLWFASDHGAVRLDPARLPVAIEPPQAVLESLRIDGQRQPLAGAIQLAAGTQDLALAIAAPAPGFAGRVALRFRLEPLQPEWTLVPAGSPVVFQRLPPGSYQLQVEVGVDGERWIPSLSLPISQRPHWWQQPLAWLVTLLAFVLATVSLVRWRMNLLRERNRRLEALVAQRGDELAGERVAVAEAQAAQVEAERQLRWHRRHRALEEWADVDATARTVYSVLSHSAGPATPEDIRVQLQSASAQPGRLWTLAEVDAAVDRLRARSAVSADPDGRLTPAKPDWQLVPDLELPLAEVISRASPRIGAYRVLERVGEGAMGEVFRAVNVHDGSLAALKLVHRDASANPETRRRLEREGELVSGLSHPNIVRLLERGEHDGRLYLAMEFLAGRTLQQRLVEPLPPPRDEAVCILRDIAAALTALHERGVIHRDLHPGNVMLVPGEPTRLLDFGLARASTSHTVTRANTLMGSLPYLAPEVVAGQPASAASDLFALGAMACECLSGQRVWRATQTLELLGEMARFEGPDASVLSGLPAALGALLRTLLDPDPGKRGSANKFIEDLSSSLILDARARNLGQFTRVVADENQPP
jgi:ligand-binding sensor domain-containing protein